MAHKDSISLQLVREALQQCPDHGLHAQCLARAGIAQELLTVADARVPAQQYARLWRALARATDDEFFGMDRRPLRSGSLAFMCRAALAQPTLRAALGVVLEFLGLMLSQVHGQLRTHQSVAQIVLPETAQPRRAFTCFTYWLLVHGVACWLVDRRIAILAVEVCGPPPDYRDDYQVMFCRNLRFDRPLSRLILAADCLALPVRRSEAELAAFLARAPDSLLVRYRDPDSLGRQLREQLCEQPAERWPEIEAQARQLSMSVATLRRRLADEGQTWQGLKDSVRKERALAWLSDPALSLAEIAEQAGFADLSSFYKAFRKWTGASPGHYRSLLVDDT